MLLSVCVPLNVTGHHFSIQEVDHEKQTFAASAWYEKQTFAASAWLSARGQHPGLKCGGLRNQCFQRSPKVCSLLGHFPRSVGNIVSVFLDAQWNNLVHEPPIV